MKSFVLLLVVFLINSLLFAQDVIDIGLYNQQLKFIDHGWYLIHQGKNKEASEQFEKAIEINPSNADCYVGAATAYMHLEQYDLATEHVNTALSLTTNQSDIYLLAGNIAFNSKEYNKSLVSYTVAINNQKHSEVKIDLARCYFNRGNAYLALENHKNAVLDYDKTLESMADFADAYHNRGIAHKNLSKLENACRDFHAAKHFGSKISDKYLSDMCNEVKFNPIDYQKLEYVINSSTNIPSENPVDIRDFSVAIDYSDTSFIDTLYYNADWELSTKDRYSYFRIGTVNTKDMIFTGNFADYYKNGQLMLNGTYDKKGKKTGAFERFYESGEYYSKGNYLNDQLIGTWEFYNENGQLSETIEFTEDDYYVINSWNENGKPGVVDGTGKWKKVLSIQNGVKNILVGHFKNNLKVKKWIVKSELGYIYHIEKYKNGTFVSAEQNSGILGSMVSAPQLLTKSSFYAASLSVIEGFEFSKSVSKENYPYIQELPTAMSMPSSYTVSVNSDSKPTYIGGLEAFYRFVADNLNYPIEARKKGAMGMVLVQFTVEKDGSVSNINCISNIGNGLEEEAIRLIEKTNQWQPAIENGKPIIQSLILPIHFKLAH